jgi:hypothetical protein
MIFDTPDIRIFEWHFLKYKAYLLVIIYILLCNPVFSHNAEIEAESFNPIIESPLPEASFVISKVLSVLPEETIAGYGVIKVQEKENKYKLEFEFKVNLRGTKRSCSYSLLDAFGDVEQQIMVVWTNETQKEFLVKKHKNTPFVKEKNYENVTVGNTDLKWSDLALDCLYWKNWETVKREEILGRKCVILQNLRNNILFNFWIDENWFVPLQWQETSVVNNTLLRTISVKSFKKMKDVWMIKDVEIYNHTNDRKTTVLFENLNQE